MFNYNGFSYWFIYNFDLQYKPKIAIVLNSMLPLVGIMNILKINQCQIYFKMYGYKMWFNNLKYTKTCCFFHMKQNVKFKISQHILGFTTR
jgi:hypothetical protein